MKEYLVISKLVFNSTLVKNTIIGKAGTSPAATLFVAATLVENPEYSLGAVAVFTGIDILESA